MSSGHDERAWVARSPRTSWPGLCDRCSARLEVFINAPIELICDAHVARDPVGPLVTLVDRRWAYCASHADGGHEWRRIAPLDREVLDAMPDRVQLVCDDPRHLEIGRTIPPGDGMLTVSDRKWAYCTASLDKEPHHWVQVEPMELHAIDHVVLAERFEGRP